MAFYLEYEVLLAYEQVLYCHAKKTFRLNEKKRFNSYLHLVIQFEANP